MSRLHKFGFETECPWCGHINDAPDDIVDWDCDSGIGEVEEVQCGGCSGYYDASFQIVEIKWDRSDKNFNWGPIEICEICEKAHEEGQCYEDCDAIKRGKEATRE